MSSVGPTCSLAVLGRFVLEPNARAPDAGALEEVLRCRQQETRLKMKLLEVSGAPGVCAHASCV